MISPKISVIVPVYNVAPYLNACLDSILAQTFTDFELILIDDASNDGSSHIISSYMRCDKRIRKITNQKNIGVAECRNLGIEIANGEFLTILDSDDFFSRDMLLEGIRGFKTKNTDISYWEHFDLDDVTGNVQLGNKLGKLVMKDISDISHPKNCPDYVFFLFKSPSWHKMYRTSFVKKNSLQFQNLSSANDVFFSRLSCVLAHEITYIRKPLVYYRRNRKGQISNADMSHGKNIILAMELLRKYMKDRGVFTLFSRAFYSAAISEVLYTLSGMRDIRQQTEYISFLKENGWMRMGMEHLFLTDFISPLDYKFWIEFNYKNDWRILPTDVSDFFESKMIEQIKNQGKKFCLWGFGRRGRKFLSIANKYGLEITCIVDSNETLSGNELDGIPIDRLERQKVLFDMVIITNSSFAEEIRYELDQNDRKNIKIIDVEYAVTFECPICRCFV